MKARAKEVLPINLHSKKYIRILQMLETQLKRNKKGNPSFYHSPSCLFSRTPPCSYDSHHLPVFHISGHDHVILFYLYTLPLLVVSWTPNQLPSTLNTVQKHITVCLSVSNMIVVQQYVCFLTKSSSDGITSH